MQGWFWRWFSRTQEEKDLSEELHSHLAIDAREKQDAGAPPDQAERDARRAFGNVLKIQEETRETWGWTAMEQFSNDIRFGVRMLRKTPVWTAVVSGTLALWVGLSTAIFSVAYAVLLQPLPYPNPDRLVAVWLSNPQKDSYSRFYVNAAQWLDWRENATLLEGLALTRPLANFNLTGDGPPERLQGARASFNPSSPCCMSVPCWGEHLPKRSRKAMPRSRC